MFTAMQQPLTSPRPSVGLDVNQQQEVRDPPLPSSPTDSDSSSTVRDLTPEPQHALGTSAPTDAVAINQDTSQIATGNDQGEAEVKPKSSKPFSSFTQNQKWGIVIMSSIAGLFSPISSVILAPSLPVLVDQFQRSSEDINLTMTLYLYVEIPLRMAVVHHLITSPLSQSLSRLDSVLLGLVIRQHRAATGLHHDSFHICRCMYRISSDTYLGVLASSGPANGTSYWRVRCHRYWQRLRIRYCDSRGTGKVHGPVQCAQHGGACNSRQFFSVGFSTTSSPTLSLFLGTSARGYSVVRTELEVDILDTRYRMRYQPDYNHLVGTDRPGKNLGVLTLPFALSLSFLPETLRSIVGDGSLSKPWYNRRPQESLKLREEAKNRFGKGILPPVEEAKLQRKKVCKQVGTLCHELKLKCPTLSQFKPFESFRMLFFPDVILMLLYSSLIYAEYYCVLTVYSQLLKKNYGYNDIQIGLCYL